MMVPGSVGRIFQDAGFKVGDIIETEHVADLLPHYQIPVMESGKYRITLIKEQSVNVEFVKDTDNRIGFRS